MGLEKRTENIAIRIETERVPAVGTHVADDGF